MPRITLKETITKEIEIPMEAVYQLIDNLTREERQKILSRLKGKALEVKPFQKDEIRSILADFEATDLYEDGFLKDLEKGLRKSSVYR
jgi:DNA-directed RNA polymerase subunit F